MSLFWISILESKETFFDVVVDKCLAFYNHLSGLPVSICTLKVIEIVLV